jgi:hypothetical protein
MKNSSQAANEKFADFNRNTLTKNMQKMLDFKKNG